MNPTQNKTSTKFNAFTNLYSLTKTLRFELIPIGNDGKRLSAESAESQFKQIKEQDVKIKEAYIALKPVMDHIHERIINGSLTSDDAKNIDFSSYFNEYKKGKKKKLDVFEKSLRKNIGESFEKAANEFAKNVGNDEKGKSIFKKKNGKDLGVKYLKQEGILKYIENNIGNLVPIEQVKQFIEKKETVKGKGKKEIVKTGHLATFDKFFTYFSGYNQNRGNYYVTEKEASTAVATRIVHENLPKFCDNLIQFSGRTEHYLGALWRLINNGKTTQIKDAETNMMIDAEPIKEGLFDIKKFSECLAQNGIDAYNRVIGHYNLLINLYNQSFKDENNFNKLPQFKTLYKQIGCGKRKALFNALKYDTIQEQVNADENTDEILNLEKLLITINEVSKKYFIEQKANTETTTIYTFTNWLRQYNDWKGVYWSKAAVDEVSNQYLANWHDIKDRIQNVLQGKNKTQKDMLKPVASYDKKREEQLKMNDAVELSGLFGLLDEERKLGWSKIFFKESILEDRGILIDEEKTQSQNLIHLICSVIEDLAKEFCAESDKILKISDYKNEDNIFQIKKWLDKTKPIFWSIKYFHVKESKIKGDTINPELSNMLDALIYAKDASWFDWYDLARNYLTQKPQEDAKKSKLKLNFGSSSFLYGLSQDFDAKAGLIFEKNGQYYLIINFCLSKKDIDEINKKNTEINDFATRIIIDFQKPDHVNTPRLFIRSNGDNYAPAVSQYNLPIEDIIDIYDSQKFKTKYRESNENDYYVSLHKLIDYFKKGFSKHDSYKHFNFEWKETSQYKDISDFYHDTEISCYKLKEEKCSWSSLLKFVDEGKIFMFQIYNKDSSQKKKLGGKDNIHTYYWKSLFNKTSVYKFGTQGAEMFFREKSIDYLPEYDNGREKGHHYKELKNKFDYPIISNRRFIDNKFLFHCPIIINYQTLVSGIKEGKPNPQAIKIVTETVNDKFTQTDDIQFLGIDRGEKHLIYYSLLNAKGEITGQGHFDEINKTNYLGKINDAANKRREKQENWQQKGNISNLKDGYISLVVHEIIEKMKDNDGNYKPSFIVLEDLNTGFKRGRQKFEQQVYQKFELALAKKLNYLVDKKANVGEIGSVTHAMQLTPPVANYQDIENRKQVGVMLYTRANYTSITDPATGWRKTIYLKKGKDDDVKKQILDVFSEISVNDKGDYRFTYNDENSEKEWMLWSGKDGKSLERYRAERGKDKNKYIVKSFDVKKDLDELFKDFDASKSLKSQLENGKVLQKVNEHSAWETLRFVIDVIQQIRNSGDASKGQDDNFLLSPVRNEEGEHFDSRNYQDQEIPKQPKDADANGAYNIARKGIVMCEHIKQWIKNGKQKKKKEKSENETTDLSLFVSDSEWDLWLLNRKKWEQNLPMFASKNAMGKDDTQDYDSKETSKKKQK
jgi:hypothetical protein